jgi:predicted nucleic-acid-binding protein
MIALDTNVLVRFLVEDDKAQSKRAKKLVEKAVKNEEELFVPDLVLVETAWVLKRSYSIKKEDIAKVLRTLLGARNLRFESSDRLARAIRADEKGRGGFSDYLIREAALERGCETVVTFDQVLQKEKGFERP